MYYNPAEMCLMRNKKIFLAPYVKVLKKSEMHCLYDSHGHLIVHTSWVIDQLSWRECLRNALDFLDNTVLINFVLQNDCQECRLLATGFCYCFSGLVQLI